MGPICRFPQAGNPRQSSADYVGSRGYLRFPEGSPPQSFVGLASSREPFGFAYPKDSKIKRGTKIGAAFYFGDPFEVKGELFSSSNVTVLLCPL